MAAAAEIDVTAPAARVLPAFCLRALRARGYMEGGLWLLRLVVSALAAALLRRQRLRCSSCSRAASRVTAHCGSFMWCCCSSRPGASRRLCPWPLMWAGVVRGRVPLLLCFVRLDADTDAHARGLLRLRPCVRSFACQKDVLICVCV